MVFLFFFIIKLVIHIIISDKKDRRNVKIYLYRKWNNTDKTTI